MYLPPSRSCVISRLLVPLAGAGILLAAVATSARAQMLETESARLLRHGSMIVGGNYEYQTSREGTETAIPFVVEYGISNRLELMIEPVAQTAIRPKTGTEATGVGDIEATLTWLARAEGRLPAVAFAAELKIPTARNVFIGTGRTDLALWAIASRRFGRLDSHVNISYTLVGKPRGAQLNNIFGGAIAGVLSLDAANTNHIFAEILANSPSTSTPESTTPPPVGTVVPEAAGGEIVGTIGFARSLANHRVELSAGISLDNNGAVLFRPGCSWRLR